jgi:hypothetical protein
MYHIHLLFSRKDSLGEKSGWFGIKKGGKDKGLRRDMRVASWWRVYVGFGLLKPLQILGSPARGIRSLISGGGKPDNETRRVNSSKESFPSLPPVRASYGP